MTFEINYLQLFSAAAVIWVIIRAVCAVKAKKISLSREALLLLVFVCIVVVARIVYFPWHLEDGHVVPMVFDSTKIIPVWYNLTPVVHLFDVYDDRLLNIFGNIALFIPVGIVWPLCFKKLRSIGRTVLACFGYTVCIEISQLFFFDRCSDVDDVLLNTTGALIGALIFFGCRRLAEKRAEKKNR